MALFEITIYNIEVRQKVEAGEHHKRFSDSWADFQYFEIGANNEDQARALVEKMHPSNQGFLIDDIRMIEGSDLAGEERGDDRRQEHQDIADAVERRVTKHRRETPFGVKLFTTSSLVELEELLDEECTDNWKVIFLGMDDKFDQKEVRIMFARKSDKDHFVASHFKLKNS